MKLSAALKTAAIYIDHIDADGYIIGKSTFNDQTKLALVNTGYATLLQSDAIIDGQILDIESAIINCANRDAAERAAEKKRQQLEHQRTLTTSIELVANVLAWDFTTWDLNTIKFAGEFDGKKFVAELNPLTTSNRVFISGQCHFDQSMLIRDHFDRAIRYREQLLDAAEKLAKNKIQRELNDIRAMVDNHTLYKRQGNRFVKL